MEQNKNHTKKNNHSTIVKEQNQLKNVMKLSRMETGSLVSGKINNCMDKWRFSIKMVTFSSK